MESLPSYIPMVFGVTTLITMLLFYWVVQNSADAQIRKRSGLILIILIIWLGVQAGLSLQHVYHERTDVLPPRIFLLGVLPLILLILYLFLTTTGQRFIDSLPLDKLAYLHLVRIPVEIVLLWLFMEKAIPRIMTFEGWNFDILAGLTVPAIIYFGFYRKKIGKRAVLMWNIIGLGLLLNIIVIAFLSAPFPFQQLAFDQPNIGVLYFPYSWLPTFVAPTVLLVHLISIRQLTKSGRETLIE